jgi:hypothetical protein
VDAVYPAGDAASPAGDAASPARDVVASPNCGISDTAETRPLYKKSIHTKVVVNEYSMIFVEDLCLML